MFLTYLFFVLLGGAALATIAFTVSYFMTLQIMRSILQTKDTNGGTIATVEDVIGGSISTAKVVKLGIFKGSERVAEATIDCPKGTSVNKYDSVYL